MLGRISLCCQGQSREGGLRQGLYRLRLLVHVHRAHPDRHHVYPAAGLAGSDLQAPSGKSRRCTLIATFRISRPRGKS